MKPQQTIVTINPAYLRKNEALKYIGVGETLFKDMANEFGLKVYARGNKAVWYKVADLNRMIEKCELIH